MVVLLILLPLVGLVATGVIIYCWLMDRKYTKERMRYEARQQEVKKITRIMVFANHQDQGDDLTAQLEQRNRM